MKRPGSTGWPVVPDLEMQIGAGGAAGGAHQGNGIALLHVVADGHQVLRVVGIAGHVTVAVGDFHHAAVALARSGPGDHAGRDRDDFGAGLGRKIDAAVIADLAGERIGAAAEVARDIAGLDGAPARAHFLAQLAVDEQVREQRELALLLVEPHAEIVEVHHEARDFDRPDRRLVRAAERRPGRKVELPVVELGHLGELAAERIETDARGR